MRPNDRQIVSTLKNQNAWAAPDSRENRDNMIFDPKEKEIRSTVRLGDEEIQTHFLHDRLPVP